MQCQRSVQHFGAVTLEHGWSFFSLRRSFVSFQNLWEMGSSRCIIILTLNQKKNEVDDVFENILNASYSQHTVGHIWIWRTIWQLILTPMHTFVDRGRWEGTRRSTTETHLEVHFYFWCSLLWHTPLFVSTVHTGRKKLQANHQTNICKCVLQHQQKKTSGTRSTLETGDSIFCRKKDLTWSDVTSR